MYQGKSWPLPRVPGRRPGALRGAWRPRPGSWSGSKAAAAHELFASSPVWLQALAPGSGVSIEPARCKGPSRRAALGRWFQAGPSPRWRVPAGPSGRQAQASRRGAAAGPGTKPRPLKSVQDTHCRSGAPALHRLQVQQGQEMVVALGHVKGPAGQAQAEIAGIVPGGVRCAAIGSSRNGRLAGPKAQGQRPLATASRACQAAPASAARGPRGRPRPGAPARLCSAARRSTPASGCRPASCSRPGRRQKASDQRAPSSGRAACAAALPQASTGPGPPERQEPGQTRLPQRSPPQACLIGRRRPRVRHGRLAVAAAAQHPPELPPAGWRAPIQERVQGGAQGQIKVEAQAGQGAEQRSKPSSATRPRSAVARPARRPSAPAKAPRWDSGPQASSPPGRPTPRRCAGAPAPAGPAPPARAQSPAPSSAGRCCPWLPSLDPRTRARTPRPKPPGRRPLARRRAPGSGAKPRLRPGPPSGKPRAAESKFTRRPASPKRQGHDGAAPQQSRQRIAGRMLDAQAEGCADRLRRIIRRKGRRQGRQIEAPQQKATASQAAGLAVAVGALF